MNGRNKSRLMMIVAVGAALLIAHTLVAVGDRPAPKPKAEEMVLVGTVVDLHSYMSGKYKSDDKAKSTRESIQAGVPAVLETEEGPVLIGTGDKSPARKLLPFAFREVELTGMLYEKDGLEYVDMESIRGVEEEGSQEDRLDGRREPGETKGEGAGEAEGEEQEEDQ